MKKKVSICMMIKNEEENLHRCLKSLVPIIESGLAELIIVDTGSEDTSIEIAKQYTDQVYEHEWTNNFSEMRNISISYAKGEWIWIIDADEEIENPKEMVAFFQRDLSKYNTISIEMKNYMETAKDGKESSYNISILNRGFRNRKDFSYSGAVHNQPSYKKPVIFSDVILGHYGYIWEDEEFKQKKFKRTAGILKQELKKDPNNIYYQYQLGVSTSIIDIEKGLEEFKKAYQLIKNLPYNERPKFLYVYGLYGKVLYEMEKYKEAIKIAKEGLKFTKDYIDLWYILSRSHEKLQENEEAIKSGKEFIKCRNRFDKSILSKDTSITFYYSDIKSEDRIHFVLSSIYIKNEDIKMALDQVDKMILSDLKTNIVIDIIKKIKDKQYLLEYTKKAFINESIKNHLILKLENELAGKESIILAEDIISLYENNYIEKDNYYYLNILRDSIYKNKKLEEEDLEKILNLEYSELPVYYGDIISYIAKNKLDVKTFRKIGRIEDVYRMTAYALEKVEDFDKDIVSYLLENKKIGNIFDFKYWNNLAKLILFREKIDTKEYMDIFEEYVKKGITYIQNIYRSNIFKEENILDLANDEHRFFFYMSRAKDVEEKDELGYIRYLRKALNQFPMKKGIEMLLDELQEENKVVEDEMEILKKQFKDNIKILIDVNKIEEAEGLIQEYEKVLPKDAEVLLFKSEILMLKLEKTNKENL